MTAGPQWTPICASSGLWTIVKSVAAAPLRSVAVRLAGEGLLLFSPIRKLGPEAHAQLATLGKPAFLLAPNHYHNVGIKEHAGLYPDALLACSAAATRRLEKVVGLEFGNLEKLVAALPPHVRVIEPPTLKNGEVFLSVETSRGRAWIVCDGFANLKEHPSGLTGLFCRTMGISHGLRVSQTFLWVGPSDRRLYREFVLDELRRAPPRILVPSHGEVLEADDLADRLKTLVEARL